MSMNPTEDKKHENFTMSAESTNPPFRLRSYQAEMVEESLKSNIIVVMDTGSGKTHMYTDLSENLSIDALIES